MIYNNVINKWTGIKILVHLFAVLKYKSIHYYKVTCTSGHYKQVKDLVASEIFVLIIKNRKFECVDDASYSVDDTACQQPSECCRRKCVKQLCEC